MTRPLILITVLFLFCWSFPPQSFASTPDANAIAQTLQVGDKNIYKGEAKLIDIYHPDFTSAKLSWQGKTISYTFQGEASPRWQALLSLSLQSKAQTAPLKITYSNGKTTRTVSMTFDVLEKSYPVQKLSVAPKYASPPASVLEKIKKDQAEIRQAFGTISSKQYWSLPLLRPVEGVTTSEYGLRREFNGQKRNPHRGLDLDGNLGETISAVEAGKVILVAEHYYGGKTVVIDHGLGVVSAYLHMNTFAVTQGEIVTRGQHIGTVGKTGRVTGPHLHLSISVLGQSINPNPLLAPRKANVASRAL